MGLGFVENIALNAELLTDYIFMLRIRYNIIIVRVNMSLINELQNNNDEKRIENILEYISDDVKNKLYTEEQIREILLIFRNYNLLSMKYETREQVLYTLMNISYEYGIKDDELINNLNSIRNGLEDDLNEYIDEITTNV